MGVKVKMWNLVKHVEFNDVEGPLSHTHTVHSTSCRTLFVMDVCAYIPLTCPHIVH